MGSHRSTILDDHLNLEAQEQELSTNTDNIVVEKKIESTFTNFHFMLPESHKWGYITLL